MLNVAYKIISSLIAIRSTKFSEKIIGEYQCSFRHNRSTIDHIFSLRLYLEKCIEFNVHILFLDFKQARDSINRSRLLKIMTKLGIPPKLVNLTKMTMANS